MAQLRTKAEILRQAEELLKLAKTMSSEHRACTLCMAVYFDKEQTRRICYCDWESDWHD